MMELQTRKFYLNDGLESTLLQLQNLNMRIFEEMVNHDELEITLHKQSLLEGAQVSQESNIILEDMKENFTKASKTVINWAKQQIIAFIKLLNRFKEVIKGRIKTMIGRGLDYSVEVEWFASAEKAIEYYYKLENELYDGSNKPEYKFNLNAYKTEAGRYLATRKIRFCDYPDEVKKLRRLIDQLDINPDDLNKKVLQGLEDRTYNNAYTYYHPNGNHALEERIKLMMFFKRYTIKINRIIFNAVSAMSRLNQNVNFNTIMQISDKEVNNNGKNSIKVHHFGPNSESAILFNEYSLFNYNNLIDNMYVEI